MSRRKSKFAPKQNLSLDELMPDREELETLSGEGSVNPEALAIRSEEAKRLREAVKRLPPSYRIVLVLRDMEGLTDEEVAEITGLRPGTVRVRLHRARLFVRKDLVRQRQQGSHGRGVRRPRTAHPVRPTRCKAMFAELSNYLDERLDDSLCEELEKHMAGCEPCQAFLASLEGAIERCRKSPMELPDRKMAAKLRKQLLLDYDRALNTTT
jgi:RNA polymerase sigma-70 factor (ECF subfamily)